MPCLTSSEVLCVMLVTVLRVRARRSPLLGRPGQPGH
jgi:hypothetical protein